MGSRPFADFKLAFATKCLRCMLSMVGIKDSMKYVSHDLRRGHTQDLVDSGADLATILLAGEWRFMCPWSCLGPPFCGAFQVFQIHKICGP